MVFGTPSSLLHRHFHGVRISSLCLLFGLLCSLRLSCPLFAALSLKVSPSPSCCPETTQRAGQDSRHSSLYDSVDRALLMATQELFASERKGGSIAYSRLTFFFFLGSGLLDNVTVLIGIAYGGRAIAGVINQPFYNYQLGAEAALGRTMWGMLGLGAFGFQLQEVPADRRIVTTTRSHSNKTVTDCVNAMEPHEVIRVGGAGNKIIQLIEGKASAYVFASPGCKKWDTCAPEAILHAVGGKLTDMFGNPYGYNADVKHMNSAGVLATLRNHDYYVSRVPQSVLQALKSE
uniref:3'(2'),5'-bisphosphate nucleotidase 1 n=1 Tax=Fundulus heteroclitus TaxID=8078 RepID=A0A3Q2PXS3_FUNHE